LLQLLLPVRARLHLLLRLPLRVQLVRAASRVHDAGRKAVEGATIARMHVSAEEERHCAAAAAAVAAATAATATAGAARWLPKIR
jgi:hypothetical protein